MNKIFFKRTGNVSSRKLILSLHIANIVDFNGHYIVTSTNPNLEGIHYRNWWGFAGKQSIDALLHSKGDSNYLMQQAQQEAIKKFGANNDRLLPFGQCVVTDAVADLNVRKIVHTCVPVHPASSIVNDGRSIPPALHQNVILDENQANDLLQESYQNVFESILNEWRRRDWKHSMVALLPSFVSDGIINGKDFIMDQLEERELRICLPAIGCGYNGYPMMDAANIAVNAIYNVDNWLEDILVEIRFNQIKTFRIWSEAVISSNLFEQIEL